MDKENDKHESHKEESFPTASLPDLSSILGEQIGPYKLLSVLGEGGFGIVYLAEQKHPIKRQVALKIIKPGMDSKQIIARFDAERQALALLDHPNIAHVFEAGSAEPGHPYFVMEYIKGLPITDYCDQHQLKIEERLKLFIQVCDAVGHAHQKGIIHRDIKPSNIIVSIQDDRAIPKVIDFGIAKAIGIPLTEKTIFTQQGQLIGTPEYMSPEQADLREKDIDTRTDIYSLGVVLYELLSGTLPFEPKTLREAGYAAIQQIIREQEAPLPSTKLSSLGEDATKVAKNRHTEVSSLVNSLHKELEWIPLMAIRKDRDQRYKSASDLAEDVQNYLDGNPLIAGPESSMYKFKKFIKKQRGLVAAVGSVAAILVISLIIISNMYLNSENLRIASVESEKAARASEEKALIAQKATQEEKDKTQAALIQEAKAKNEAEKARDKAEKQLYCNRIALADMYKDSNVMHALELLDSCREDLLGWEWYWLQKSSQDKALLYHIIYKHQEMVNGVACSPDGRLMASVGNDFKLMIWDLQTGKNIGIYSRFHGSPISVTFSPDGKYVLTGSFDGVNRIWDVQTGNVVKSIDFGINDGTYQACYGPDGTYVVSGNEENIILWDIENEKEILNIPEHQGISSIAINPDGKSYASVNRGDQSIKIWDTKSDKVIKVLEGHTGGLCSIAYSPDGTKIVSGGEDKTIILWDIHSGTSSDLGRHEGKILAVVFSPDGKAVASGGEDNIVRLWDVQTRTSRRFFRGHEDAITSLSFAPDGKKLVSGSKDTSIIIWDLQVEQNEKEIRFSVYNKIRSVAISPDADYFMSTNGDSGIIQFLSIRTGKVEKQFAYPSVWEACYSLDGKYFAAASYDNSFKVWETTSRKLLCTIDQGKSQVGLLALSPDGKKVLSCNPARKNMVYDVVTAKPLFSLKWDKNGFDSAVFSPDGSVIITSDWDGIIFVWNAKDGQLIKTLVGLHGRIAAFAFSPDGKRLVSACSDRTARIWNLETGDETDISPLMGHGGGVNCITFTSDGKRIVTGSDDRTIKIWDSETGYELLTLQGHKDSVICVGFTPEDSCLISASSDGVVKVWNTELATIRSENAGKKQQRDPQITAMLEKVNKELHTEQHHREGALIYKVQSTDGLLSNARTEMYWTNMGRAGGYRPSSCSEGNIEVIYEQDRQSIELSITDANYNEFRRPFVFKRGQVVVWDDVVIERLDKKTAGTIKGVIHLEDNADPNGIKVARFGGGPSAVTNEKGEFILTNMPAGNNSISADKPGYHGLYISVQVAKGQTVTCKIEGYRDK